MSENIAASDSSDARRDEAERLLAMDPAEAVRSDPDGFRALAEKERDRGNHQLADAIESRIQLALEGSI